MKTPRGNSRRMARALLAALLLSGAGTFLLSRRISHIAAAEQIGTRRYISTVRPVQPGEVLRAQDVQTIAWPANNPVAGALTRVEEVAGRAVLYPLAPGQPLLDRELATPGSGPGLASKVPNGMRAIALRCDEVVGVAGFLNPGSHVDVLATYHNTGAEPVSTMVLQNAEVIAAGQQLEPDPSGKAVAATVVTLLLDTQKAERALLASTLGTLHFVLRNSADTTLSNDAPVTFSQLTNYPGSDPAASDLRATAAHVATKPAARAAVHPKPDLDGATSIEIVLGGQSGQSGNAPARQEGK